MIAHLNTNWNEDFSLTLLFKNALHLFEPYLHLQEVFSQLLTLRKCLNIITLFVQVVLIMIKQNLYIILPKLIDCKYIDTLYIYFRNSVFRIPQTGFSVPLKDWRSVIKS